MSSAMFEDVRRNLVCPKHRGPLSYEGNLAGVTAVPWPDGEMKCTQGCRWLVRNGIPRFVAGNSYATSFGVQWNRYPRTELDSFTGKSYSRDRLERCLGAPLESLRGKVVLECGSGAGRFTELLIRHAEAL